MMNLTQFETTIWVKHNTQWQLAMEQNLANYDFDLKDVSVKTLKKNAEMSNKCNQCDYASSQTGHLRTHLIMHSGEKSNRFNQCDFVTFRVDNLRSHLKMHSGETPNKCNHCDYASSQTGHLRTHLKTHSGEKPNKCKQCNYASSVKTV